MRQLLGSLVSTGYRQNVFTLPRLLRPIFRQHRPWLGEMLLADPHSAANHYCVFPILRIKAAFRRVSRSRNASNCGPSMLLIAVSNVTMPFLNSSS